MWENNWANCVGLIALLGQVLLGHSSYFETRGLSMHFVKPPFFHIRRGTSTNIRKKLADDSKSLSICSMLALLPL